MVESDRETCIVLSSPPKGAQSRKATMSFILNLPLARRILTVGAVLAMALAISAAIPEAADAACVNTGTSFSSATYYGKEDSRYTSTCDGDDYYAGRVLDILTDGYGVKIEAWPNGNYWVSSMSTGSWKNFQYSDSNGNNTFRICRTHLTWGWMTNCGVTGTNNGF